MKMIMESQNCVFCESSLIRGNTVKLYPKGCDTINQVSERRDDSIGVKKEIEPIKNAEKTYTQEYSMIID